MPPLQIFEWCAWEKYLVTHLVPNARRIPVTPGCELRRVEQQAAAAQIHVNLSRPGLVFPDYDEWLAGYEEIGLPVLNGYCRSIDKWATQDACEAAGLPCVRADRSGDPEEVLVVKMRANHLGRYEAELPEAMVGAMAPPPWPYPERIHTLARKDVPDAMWDDARLTFERYVSNAEDKFYRAYVAGDYVAVAASHSPKLVKEMDHRNGVALTSTTAGPARALDDRDPLAIAHRLARAMRVDFAAIDLAVDDAGVAYAIDLNTTPVWGRDPTLNPRLIAELSEAYTVLVARGSGYGPA
jgi:hypothetical protein